MKKICVVLNYQRYGMPIIKTYTKTAQAASQTPCTTRMSRAPDIGSLLGGNNTAANSSSPDSAHGAGDLSAGMHHAGDCPELETRV